MADAIEDAYEAGILFVAAAGNAADNCDLLPFYPACYDVDNVVSVAATDHNDDLASFSNFGAASVDLGAPGVDILSTVTGFGYDVKSGTSMAAPHVAGAAALMWSAHSSISVDSLKALLLISTDEVPGLAGRCVTGGRLNAYRGVAGPDHVPPAAVTDLTVFDPGSNTMRLAWTATGDDGGVGRARRYQVRYSTSPITEGTFYAATRAGNEPDPQPAGSQEEMEVAGLDFNTTYYFAIKVYDRFGNESPISNLVSGTTLGIPDIAISPTSLTEELTTGHTSARLLRVQNTGEGTLDFGVSGIEFTFSGSAAGAPGVPGPGRRDPPGFSKGIEGTPDFSPSSPSQTAGGGHSPAQKDFSPVVEASSGPDQFGYWWIDSKEPGGPVFDWVDITSIGTPVPLGGDNASAGPFDIGFPFPFYGEEFESFNVCTNGFISFTSDSVSRTNRSLPSVEAPENLVAPFWDNLVVVGDKVYMYNDGSRLIVEFDGLIGFQTGGPYTFELILYPSGTIVFQYLSMDSPTDEATVGIQNAGRDKGILVAHNRSYIHDGLAVRIWAAPLWLSVPHASGRLHAGEHMDLEVSFNARGLAGGDYEARIMVESNDPDEDPLLVPASLYVDGAPDIAVGGQHVSVSSKQEFYTRGASTDHALATPASVGGPGWIKVGVLGDYTIAGQYATVYVEGTALGTLGPAGWAPGFADRTFALSLRQLQGFLADGVVNVTVQNSDLVGAFCGQSYHDVILSYRDSGETLDFGTVYVGFPDTLDLLVQNPGVDILNVTAISVDEPAFSTSDASFDLAPGTSKLLRVVFAPPAAGAFAGVLSVESNDPDEPLVLVALTGEGLEPPVVEASSHSLNAEILRGQTGEQQFMISNEGGSELTISVLVRGVIEDWDAGDMSAVGPPTLQASKDMSANAQVLSGSLPLSPASDGIHASPQMPAEYSMPSQRSLDLPSRLGPAPGYTDAGGPWASEDRSAGAFADVLLVEDEADWDYETPMKEVLEANGLTYDLLSWRQLGEVDLDPYRIVVLPGDQPYALWDSVAAYQSKIETYMSQGGVLQAHASPSTMTGRGPSGAVLPGGMGVSRRACQCNRVLLPGHPMARGVSSPFCGYFCYYVSEGYFTSVPPGTDVVAVDLGGDPTHVSRRFGEGLMLATTLNLESCYPRHDDWTRILSSMVAYANSASGADWLALEPASGSLAPGDSLLLTARYDASDLDVGEYEAGLVFFNNDPQTRKLIVPVTLTVIAIPDIAVTPSALDFGDVFVGFSSSINMVVANEGPDPLSVTDIASSSGDFSCDVTSFDLNPGQSRSVNVTFSPGSEGEKSAELTIHSNDPHEPQLGVPVTGTGLVPPDIGMIPDSVVAVCHPDIPRSKTLTLVNRGGSDLAFKIGPGAGRAGSGRAELGAGVGGAEVGAEDGAVAGSGQPGRREGTQCRAGAETVWPEDGRGGNVGRRDGMGAVQPWGEGGEDTQPAVERGDVAETERDPVAQNSGGPDAFGYRWVDSDEPGGPTFVWVDITGVGTPVPMSGRNENSGPYPIGFEFPFYGETFNAFRVCTNGFISFTSADSPYDNLSLPDAQAPGNLIAPWWDNLDFAGVDRVLCYNDGARLIVEFVEVPRARVGGPYTFEVILYPDGKIVLQYLSMVANLDGATIGIQNAGGDDGLEIACNCEYVHDDLAIEVYAANWLSCSPSEGTIPAGGAMDLAIAFDAGGMAEGEYERRVVISSNDPYKPLVSVPVHMSVRVVEAAYVDFEPNTLNLNSKGNWVTGHVELPSGLDPADVVVSTVVLEGTVPAAPGHFSLGDVNHNGVDDLTVKFDRSEVCAALPLGDSVPVTIAGEIENTAWFTGTASIRVIGSHMASSQDEQGEEIPQKFALFQNAPNPALGATVIAYDLPGPRHVVLKIFSASGALVRTLIDSPMPAGRHKAFWDGTDDRGKRVGSGVYFYYIQAGEIEASKKLVMVK